MTREEKAVEYKHNGNNCCQAVVKAVADLAGADQDVLCKTASGFAVGMGRMEATCGALIGAVMVAGLVKDGRGSVMAASDILDKFHEYSGATVCRELKGRDTGTVLCECDDCVRNAVRAFCEVFHI